MASSEKRALAVSLEELQKHASADDLWISINGKVYDVTPWLTSHPGGDIPLLSLAGQDVTDTFLAFHPLSAAALLPRFLVGTLTDYQVSPLASDYRKTLTDLRKAGLFRKNHSIYFLLFVVITAMLGASVAGVLLSSSLSVHLVSALLLGCVWTQCGWIGHDTGHSPVLGKPSIDRCIALLVGNIISGISISWWKRNHNAHHISCNSLEYDPDLQYIPIFAVSSKLFSSLHSYFYERKMAFDPVARLLVSYQHWTFYPVMAVARINLFAQTLILLLSNKRIQNRSLEIASVLCFWAWFIALLSCLPNNFERVAFVLVSFAVTGIQHVQFCLNHFSSPVYNERPTSMAFAQAQVRGTLNLLTPVWMDWFHGGLQFQVEHHLFPRLPRHNLRKISGSVKSLCDKHGLPYTAVSFWEANAMIIRTLRTAALQARDWSKPIPKNLVWEAVNAQG
ncbi:hypothetical protein GOP47_0009192 [Adiantum capillus-veneris]|uniref:Cytochrome b5 heme-binding domain-containing protein n=1 Tax=Adiantum capillus-veneris TaxID=13818 RepID=A0A9D4ZJA8_ADICA|nr:hypothetical protein GOP47_0009192 [Adiantum capillus-veneris]